MPRYFCKCWIDLTKLIYDFRAGCVYGTTVEAESIKDAENEALRDYILFLPILSTAKCKCRPKS